MAESGDLWVPRFLLGVGVCFDIVRTSELLLYTNHVRYVWLRDIRRPSMKNMWRVDQFFPCMVYID
jgi:hypothetical protein